MTSDEIKAAIDRLEAIPCDDTPGVYGVTGALMDMDMYRSYNAIGLRNRLIGLLEQADPDTHIVLPKDADGMPIHVGDEIDLFCTTDDRTMHPMRITIGSLSYDRDGWGLHSCEKPFYIDPKDVRHRKPTVEEVLKHVINSVVEYAYEHQDNEIVDAYIDEVASVYGKHLRNLMEAQE